MGGFSAGKSSSEMPKEMIAIIEQVFGESSDLRQDFLGQLMGILTGQGPRKWVDEVRPGRYETVTQRTGIQHDGRETYETVKKWIPGGEVTGGHWEDSGDPDMTLPLISQAQEAQRRATSQAMTGTQENLAQKGLVGTPFGELILSQQRQQGAQAVQGVESNILQQFLQMIPGMVTGNIQSIMGALPGTRESGSWNFGANYGGASGGAGG